MPIHADRQLAALIAELAADRERLSEWAQTAVAFAKNHTLEKGSQRRVAHFDAVLEDRQLRSGRGKRRLGSRLCHD